LTTRGAWRITTALAFLASAAAGVAGFAQKADYISDRIMWALVYWFVAASILGIVVRISRWCAIAAVAILRLHLTLTARMQRLPAVRYRQCELEAF
jgi:hypothetical protein